MRDDPLVITFDRTRLLLEGLGNYVMVRNGEDTDEYIEVLVDTLQADVKYPGWIVVHGVTVNYRDVTVLISESSVYLQRVGVYQLSPDLQSVKSVNMATYNRTE